MTAGVNFDFLIPGFAVQLKLVFLFKAGFSDVIRALVIGFLLVLFDDIDIGFVDPIDVAEGMRGNRTERVLTEQARLDFNAGEKITIGRETGDFLVIQPGADGQAFKRLAFFEQLAETASVLGQNFNKLTKILDRDIQILHLGWRDFECERRVIACQHRAVSIKDDTPIGRDRHQRDSVVFGARSVVVVLDDLQKNKATDQQGKAQHHDASRNDDARAETIKLAILGGWCGVPDAQGSFPQIGRLASRSTG